MLDQSGNSTRSSRLSSLVMAAPWLTTPGPECGVNVLVRVPFRLGAVQKAADQLAARSCFSTRRPHVGQFRCHLLRLGVDRLSPARKPGRMRIGPTVRRERVTLLIRRRTTY